MGGNGDMGSRYMGRPCSKGHSVERYHHNGACVQCELDSATRRRNGQRESERERVAAWKAANREKVRQQQARHRARRQRLKALLQQCEDAGI